MWMLSLQWLLLAVFLFWVVGAFKRLKLLRHESKQAFAAVDAQCVQAIDWLRHCARLQTLKDKVAGTPLEHMPHALLPSADLLQEVLLQARQQPLQSERIAALESTWRGAQVAWQAYVQLSSGSTGVPDDQLQEWSLHWLQLTTLHRHSTDQFNAAVHDYNRAIAQFPACVIARLSGLRPVRTFQKDAALLMQPTA